MNFNHLEYAVAVSRYGSISKAAQKLFMSQPYLSGMIRGMEEELGYKIFERNKSGIELTFQGEQFMKSAQLILLELKKIKEICGEEKEQQLNISCFYATYIMEQFLRFKNESDKKLPDKIKEMGNKEVMESVMTGESTLGFIFYAWDKQDKYQKMADERGLKMSQLFKPLPTYVIISKEHPLAGQDGVSLAELKEYPYVCYDDSSSKMFLKVAGIEDHSQLLEVSDRGSFYDALTSGGYLSIMAFANPPRQEGLVLLPLKDKELMLGSSYVTGKNYELRRREREFLEFLIG